MNVRQLAELVFKGIGIYAAFEFIASIPGLVIVIEQLKLMRFDGVSDSGLSMLTVVSLVSVPFLYLVFALLFFTCAKPLARTMVGDHEDKPLEGEGSFDAFQTFILQCLGFYALIQWLPPLIQHLVAWMVTRSVLVGSQDFSFLLRFNSPSLLSAAIGSVLGILLIFRASGIKRLIQQARPMQSHDT